MNDENQDSIRNTIAEALNKIHDEYVLAITEINAEWIDVVRDGERKKILTYLEIEAQL